MDQACAAANLSYAHELGHNEGLQHDPANAGSAGAFPYAYGYQDPSGLFRTVMSYGGATRIPYFSSPNVYYNGVRTGLSSQDNARALGGTVSTVANFVNPTTGATTTTCTYTVTPTSLSFSNTGGTMNVSVSAPAGCAWSAENTLAWVTLGSTTGSGSASVAVSTPSYTGTTARSGSVKVAGVTVSVSQKAPKVTGRRK